MQFRYLGGAVGLGIVTAVFNNHLRPRLASIVAPNDAARILQSTTILQELPAPLLQDVQGAFGNSFVLE